MKKNSFTLKEISKEGRKGEITKPKMHKIDYNGHTRSAIHIYVRRPVRYLLRNGILSDQINQSPNSLMMRINDACL